MIVTIVNIKVKEEHIGSFIEITRFNHERSIKEKGNLRFDFLQNSEDPSKFTLYEAYATEEAAAAHKETTHYKKWRETVDGWMAEPRLGIRHNVIEPSGASLW